MVGRPWGVDVAVDADCVDAVDAWDVHEACGHPSAVDKNNASFYQIFHTLPVVLRVLGLHSVVI